MKKYCFDLSFAILLFLFSIFALTNIGFIFHLSVNYFYVLISFLISEIYLFKSGNFFQKNILLFIFFALAFVFSMCFIDVSFDGRCYHFTLENLFRLGYNPIFDKIIDFSKNHHIYYNLVFASSYPNAIELLRSNFYLIFNNMEITKSINYLLSFCSFFYSLYFLRRKLSITKTLLLGVCIFTLTVLITQINTKMADFSLYCIFVLQMFSLILIDKKKDVFKNSVVFVLSSIFAIGIKYTGLLNTVVIIVFYLILKRNKEFLKLALITVVSSLILCFQPYGTNIIKFKNPFYPSVGYNKLDFMTGQNPKEFLNKPYLYKFVRSMFSSTSDARINNPETPPIFWKIPFTTHFDMPFVQEELRISGFGHLFSGIFLLSFILSIYLMAKKKKSFLPFGIIYLTTFLNPICWWARFVVQLHLLPCMVCYYFRKNNIIFYLFVVLLLLNGFMTLRENYFASAYKTYIMNEYYDYLYRFSQKHPLEIYKDTNYIDEDDETILERMKEYGVNFKISNDRNKYFEPIKTQATISKSYYIKF